MNHRHTRLTRIAGANNSGQHFIIDFDQRGGVLRLIERLGDNHRNLIADVTHFALRQWRMRRLFHRLTVNVGNQPAAGQAADFCGGKIIACEYRDHAGCGIGFAQINTANFGVCMRRTQKVSVCLACHRHVVGVSAAAGEKALIFLALDALADI